MPRRAPSTLLLTVCIVSVAHGADVQVAVAANFAAPIQKIAAAFERDSGHRAIVSIGSTGKFYTQIRQGAPFEVLLAADDETPRQLENEGLAIKDSRFTYAKGTLVLWSVKTGAIDAQGEVLRTGTFERLAIADPKLAPYGRAAQETLERMNLWNSLKPRLVQGESVGQAYQFVASGNATLGFVALSQVMQDGRIHSGSAWIVPDHLHQPILQDAALLSKGRSNPAAQALLTYLRSDKIVRLIQAYGYDS